MLTRQGIRRPALAAAGLAVLVLGAGCNTGSTPPTTPEPTPSATASASSSAPPPTTPSPAPPPPAEPRPIDLALDNGSTIRVAASDANEAISVANPAQVGFSDVECDDQFDNLGTDPDGRIQDVEAGKNKQLCLVELSVTNVGTKPISWTAEETASLIASDRKEYLISDTRWSAGAAADEAKKRYSGDGDLIARGKTEYDYVVFEIPDDTEPVRLRFLV